jgi:hypothetical protein
VRRGSQQSRIEQTRDLMPRQIDRQELTATNYASLAAGDVWPKHLAMIQRFDQ